MQTVIFSSGVAVVPNGYDGIGAKTKASVMQFSHYKYGSTQHLVGLQPKV